MRKVTGVGMFNRLIPSTFSLKVRSSKAREAMGTLPMVRTAERNTWFWLTLLLCVLLSGGALAWMTREEIATVAVYHDELYSYPAAISALNRQARVPEQELALWGLRLPLVTAPYQGALKSWLAIPIFACFGSSPLVTRSIHAALCLLYALSFTWALWPVTTRWVAILPALLPVMDSNLLTWAPIDQGPFLTQNVLIVVAIGGLFRFTASPAMSGLVFASLASGAFLAEKLTGTPLLIGLLAGGVAAFCLRPLRRPGVRPILLCVVLLGVPLIPTAAYFLRAGFAPLMGMVGADALERQPYLPQLLQDARYFLHDSFGSLFIIGGVTELRPSPVTAWLPVVVGVLWLGALLLTLQHRTKQNWRVLVITPGIWIVALLVMPLIGGLNRPWHYWMLHGPFMLTGFVSLGVILNADLDTRLRRVIQLSAVAGVTLACITGLDGSAAASRHLRAHQGVNLTSPALYQVYRYLEAGSAQHVTCLSYSLADPLYVVSGGRINLVDATWSANMTERIATLLPDVASGHTDVIFRQFVETEYTKGDYLSWLNRGSDAAEKVLPEWDRLIQRRLFRDARGTVFVVLQAKQGSQATNQAFPAQ